MAVSGSYDFTRTETQLIQSSLRAIGALAKAETPDDEDYAICSEALNILIKAWQTKGIGLWLNQECTLYLQADTIEYSLGPSGDHWTADPHKTELAAAGSSGATTITVDSYSGMADGDYIGIECDDGTLHWSTIDTPASTTITIDDALDDDVSVDSHVYFYTAKAQRPLEIVRDTIRRVDENDYETPVALISASEYRMINDKTNEGPVNSVYFEPLLTNAKLYTWPETDSVKNYLRMTVRRPISDVDSLSHNIEIPNEFLRAMKWNLAIEIAPEFEMEVTPLVERLADESLEDARGLIRENASVYIR